jgi:hypothetical protein
VSLILLCNYSFVIVIMLLNLKQIDMCRAFFFLNVLFQQLEMEIKPLSKEIITKKSQRVKCHPK